MRKQTFVCNMHEDFITCVPSKPMVGCGCEEKSRTCKTKITCSKCQRGHKGSKGSAGSRGSNGLPGPAGPQGPPGNNATCIDCPPGPKGDIGPAGPKGDTGATGNTGATGPKGDNGGTGAKGDAGASGVVGVAQFVRKIQTPNNSVPPGQAFTIDTEVINTIPVDVIASAGAGGTFFTLTNGLYSIDYEMSLTASGSVAIYKGPTSGSLAIDTDTISGSATRTTWIHGRCFLDITTASRVVAVSSVVGTAAVPPAGSAAGFYMIRLTIEKFM